MTLDTGHHRHMDNSLATHLHRHSLDLEVEINKYLHPRRQTRHDTRAHNPGTDAVHNDLGRRLLLCEPLHERDDCQLAVVVPPRPTGEFVAVEVVQHLAIRWNWSAL